MCRRTFVLAVLAITATALPAAAAPGRALHVDSLNAGVLRGDLGPAGGGDPFAVARSALRRAAHRLGVRAADFRFESVRTSLIGRHVRGRQYVGDVPVAGTSAAVHVIGGRVVQVEARPTDAVGRPTPHPVPAATAVKAAVDQLGVLRLLVAPAATRALVDRSGVLVDTWRVSVVAARPAVSARVDVAAVDGHVIAVADVNRYVEGSAKIFDPNPIVRLRDPSLRQPLETNQSADADLDDPRLTSARTVVALHGLDAGALQQGRLAGPWVNVIAPGYFTTGQPAFDITRGDPRFEGLMAYGHLDRVQRYFQSLGFRGAAAANAEPQDIVATRIEGYDNSFYQPGNDIMVLGTGGVDDGEDAEVIVHEYGHAVQDAQVPGFGETEEGGSMGEGFGDWLAANYYARSISRGFQDVCLMEWDSTTYSTSNPTCIRRTDSKKHYPKDVMNEVHADGEMWSTFLWRVRAGLGKTAASRSDNATRLVLTSHELLTPTARFADGVAALRTAAKALHHPEWVRIIEREARRTGFDLG
ncbi:MAG: M4 family metallopeptidase [Frankia sp.]|nr:M4 family metallopeptidase [Frankia sp.]